MSDAITGLLDAVHASSQRCCMGSIVGSTSDGRPIVTYSGCNEEGVVARVLSGTLRDTSLRFELPVLLLFPDEQERPIILGAVSETLETITETIGEEVPAGRELQIDPPDAVLADNKQVVIEAQNEIILKCGKSSIVMHRDGKVVIKGKRLISRASETNKIRGGSVFIN